jgi:formate-dependent nitrite reductase cytochrome c552 subunit
MTTVLVLKIGGHDWRGRTGIHGRHLDKTERISYIATDGRRQVVPHITYLDDNGQTVVFESTDVKPTPEQLRAGEHRRMDCMDCHNRPTHAFQLPERAVDQAMSTGEISPDLPFAKKLSVELLRTEYPHRSAALERIPAAFTEFYKSRYPAVYRSHRSPIEAAAQRVQAIYRRNVFPHMKIGWGTYPNNIGHEDFLGCFRCHDGSHTSKDGRTISQDCSTCHTILAMEETNPKILSDLGLK